SSERDELILVEEPELGIHPHQFHLVMQFLKEQAETKQIIISTHSPQALNYLNEDELSNILITKYDAKKGTQVKHLTKPQINKAKKYMKEVGFLSDYWMMSDLEE
ncbi:MAG TPA: AAA family ATPase, partial [Chitinophagales bacterium]|nr:AAA family ATPase [Chitinophagales bacterium]